MPRDCSTGYQNTSYSKTLSLSPPSNLREAGGNSFSGNCNGNSLLLRYTHGVCILYPTNIRVHLSLFLFNFSGFTIVFFARSLIFLPFFFNFFLSLFCRWLFFLESDTRAFVPNSSSGAFFWKIIILLKLGIKCGIRVGYFLFISRQYKQRCSHGNLNCIVSCYWWKKVLCYSVDFSSNDVNVHIGSLTISFLSLFCNS